MNNPIDGVEYMYSGTPTVNIDKEAKMVDLIVGSCCYEYRVEELSPQQAVSLGALLMKFGEVLISDN